MALNTITLQGRLTKDPVLRYTSSGVAVASFSLAVDRDYGKDREKETDFFDISAWRGTGEFAARWFGKGDMAVVSGRLQTSKWTDQNGNSRTSYVVVAEHVYFCGSRRDGSGSNEAGGAGEAPRYTEINADDGDLPF